MSGSIHISSGGGLTIGKTSSPVGGGGSAIDTLKAKLSSLQKDLMDAMGEQTKEGMAKVKLIQMQIQVTQAQLEQIMQQQAQEAAEASQLKQGELSSQETNKITKFFDPVLGNNVNEVV